MRGLPPRDVRQALFGGRGQVTVTSLLGESPGALPFRAALRCELSPGGSVGPHRQEREVELVLGISGKGRAFVDGVAESLEAGTMVLLPLGAVLRLENDAADTPLVYWIVKASAPK